MDYEGGRSAGMPRPSPERAVGPRPLRREPRRAATADPARAWDGSVPTQRWRRVAVMVQPDPGLRSGDQASPVHGQLEVQIRRLVTSWPASNAADGDLRAAATSSTRALRLGACIQRSEPASRLAGAERAALRAIPFPPSPASRQGPTAAPPRRAAASLGANDRRQISALSADAFGDEPRAHAGRRRAGGRRASRSPRPAAEYRLENMQRRVGADEKAPS